MPLLHVNACSLSNEKIIQLCFHPQHVTQSSHRNKLQEKIKVVVFLLKTSLLTKIMTSVIFVSLYITIQFPLNQRG